MFIGAIGAAPIGVLPIGAWLVLDEASTPPPDTEEGAVGGWKHRKESAWAPPTQRLRTKEEIRAERERLGIIPKQAQKVIKRIAKKAPVDQPKAKVTQDLKAAIEQENLAWRAHYADALALQLDVQAQALQRRALLLSIQGNQKKKAQEARKRAEEDEEAMALLSFLLMDD